MDVSAVHDEVVVQKFSTFKRIDSVSEAIEGVYEVLNILIIMIVMLMRPVVVVVTFKLVFPRLMEAFKSIVAG